MQLKGSKPLVYLDQNWVSEIIKARTKRTQTDFFNTLLSVLETGVSENKFACPTSQFHSEESLLDSRIASGFDVIEKLGAGLRFNYSSSISQQLVSAASSFAGQEPPATPWWAIPFNKNPDVSIDQVPRQDQWNPLYPDGQAAESRHLKNNVGLPLYRGFKKSRVHQRLTYTKEMQLSMKQLCWEGYVGPLKAISETPEILLDPAYLIRGYQQLRRQEQLVQICDKGEGFPSFLESSQFAGVPFLATYARLRSADIVRFQNRRPTASLLTDFSWAATVLPYAHVVATENYIAELIKQTHLGSHFNCHVFTMREKDSLVDYLTNL